MLLIDGSMGEGGGQILRTSLALSLCCDRPFRIRNIRQARRRPGLRPQHLAAVRAAAAISRAEVEGDRIGSVDLWFAPGTVEPGDYQFDIGTAGSASLVLQTVLPALARVAEPSALVITGGTHNERAPTFEFMERAFLPIVRRMGIHCRLRLERAGYYPAGGGRIRAEIAPSGRFLPLSLNERGTVIDVCAHARIAHLPRHVAERELGVVRRELGIPEERAIVLEDADSAGPGNIVNLIVTSTHVTEVFSGFGRRGMPAERVAAGAAARARQYLESGVPVGRHLADQLLLPMVLAGGSSFTTLAPSSHTRTNAALLAQFTGSSFRFERVDAGTWRVTLDPRPGA
jgi:RNA 3'-terminal phosphate cyclase (ATP)